MDSQNNFTVRYLTIKGKNVSLNWKEINLILSDLPLQDALIDKILQSDFRNLFLRLYQPHQPFWVRISLEQRALRIHRAHVIPKKPKKTLRFQEYLNAHIRGGRILSAEQIGSDRIIRINVAHRATTFLIWIKLWQGSENVIVSTEDMRILEAAFRRPKQSISKDAVLRLPEASQPPNLEIRSHTGNFSHYIAQYYADLQHTQHSKVLNKNIEQGILKRRIYYQQNIEKLKNTLSKNSRSAEHEEMGNILLTHAATIRPHQAWFSHKDSTQNKELKIPLDPSKSAVQNAEHYFMKAKTAKAKCLALRARLKDMEMQYATFEALSDEEKYKELLSRPLRTAPQKEKTHTGMRYLLHGYCVLVGRNARENDEIIRHQVKGNDIWLHARDFPGSHVFIKRRSKHSLPPHNVILDAAMLAVHYSKGNRQQVTDVYMTEVKNLRRAKHGVLGTMIPLREKNLSIRIDQKKLASLLQKY